MGKIKIILLYLLCSSFSVNSAVIHSVKDNVVRTYTNEIGVRELTGNNDGVRVVTYLKAANLGKGNPWCAAFVCWTFRENNIKVPISGYCPNWFPKKNVVKNPQQADVFGIWFSNKGRIAHVGFIHKWIDGEKYCTTVEGNTNDAGSRDGDGVYSKRRLKRQIYIVSRWIN